MMRSLLLLIETRNTNIRYIWMLQKFDFVMQQEYQDYQEFQDTSQKSSSNGPSIAVNKQLDILSVFVDISVHGKYFRYNVTNSFYSRFLIILDGLILLL